MFILFQTPTSLFGPIKVSSLNMSLDNGLGDLLSIFNIINNEGSQALDLISRILCVLLSIFLI